MFKYAQIDEGNVVVAISDLSGEIQVKNMILIDENVEIIQLGSFYDPENHTFKSPVISEQPEPQPTVEEKLLAETQYQTMLLEMSTLGGM